jgi:ABC-2 type transport system ATP-binding protein
MNVIETHALSRRFGSNEALHALDLSVPAGSICALLGANGAGKTTTIKLLMNLVAPTAGRAQVLGTDSRRLSPRELAQIGYVSENQKLPRWMSIRQYLDYCRPFYPQWDRDLERALTAQFGLPVDRKLGHLSRGMLVKVALLSALSYRPKLLILDEPFSGLDPLVREEFVHGVIEVSTLGEWTVLVSSHDVEEVERLADRIALLEEGRLRLNEPIEALQNRFRRVEVTGAFTDVRPAPTWLEWEQAGALTQFIETEFQGETTEHVWAQQFSGASVSARPLSLREIFICLARSRRRTPELKFA